MNDSIYWYNVPTWAEYGLAVPNFGNDISTQNNNIYMLTQTVGRAMQQIMFHVDAMKYEPPSINTITRIHKMCVRVRDVLAARSVSSGTPKMESDHAKPAPEVFKVYPVPFFKVNNSWLKTYCQYALIALSDAMQMVENVDHFDISEVFAVRFGQYFNRIYEQIAIELFQLPVADVRVAGFTLTDDHLKAYDPYKWFTRSESIDTVPSFTSMKTEDGLKVLTDGIAVTQLPALGPWPNSGVANGQQPVAQTSGSSFNTNVVI